MTTTGAVSRPLIIGALAVHAAAALTMLLWHPATLWVHQLDGLIPVVLALAALGFIIAIPIRAKVRTVGFLVRPGVGFVAPTERRVGYFVTALLLMAANFIGGGSVYQRAPATTDTERWVDIIFTAGGTVGTTVLVLITYLYVFFVLAGWPRLELTPDGVRLRSIWPRIVRFDELAPSRLTDQDSVTLPLNRPVRPVKLPLLLVGVHALFVADAIQFYLKHPERRAAIGAQAEYDHLVQALSAVAAPS